MAFDGTVVTFLSILAPGTKHQDARDPAPTRAAHALVDQGADGADGVCNQSQQFSVAHGPTQTTRTRSQLDSTPASGRRATRANQAQLAQAQPASDQGSAAISEGL